MKIAPLNQASMRLTPVEELLALNENDREAWKATQSGYFTIVKDSDQARELLSKICKLGRHDPSNGIYDVINKITSPVALYVETNLGRDDDVVDFTPLDEPTLQHMLDGVKALTKEAAKIQPDI
jgi:hypothetical protein